MSTRRNPKITSSPDPPSRSEKDIINPIEPLINPIEMLTQVVEACDDRGFRTKWDDSTALSGPSNTTLNRTTVLASQSAAAIPLQSSIEASAINQALNSILDNTPDEPPITNDSYAHDKPPSAYDVHVFLLKSEHIVNAGRILYIYNDGFYSPKSGDDLRQFVMCKARTAVKAVGSATLINKVLELLRAEPTICRDKELSLKVCAFDDGLLDLESGQFSPHNPNVFVTTRFAASYGRGRCTTCPNFEQFLHTVSGGDSILERRIWECVGYLLAPDQTDKHFILFQGVANSGKSVLGDFVRTCFKGDVVSVLEINELSGRFDLYDLVGKKLCLDMDLPADPLTKRAVSKLKKLTGGDMTSSDVKYDFRARFICMAKFLFGTNHAVILPNDDPAFNERLVVVPFAYSVPDEQRDRRLREKLSAERDAIIVRALDAYRQLVARSFIFSGDFNVNTVLGGSESLSDQIVSFLNTDCEIDTDAWTTTQQLYTRFTEKYGFVCGDKQFSRIFLQVASSCSLPVEKHRERLTPTGNPVQGFKGVRLKEPEI